jgi:hypothetical protein
MSDDRCALTWKAAALADGRLEGADRTSFEKHAAGCEDCRAEQKALAKLYADIRARPVTEPSEIEHARRRSALLNRANERFVGRPPVSRARCAAVAAVLVVAAGGAIYARRATVSPASPHVEDARPPQYEATAAPHATWRTRSEGATARIDLADGTLIFQVESVGPKQRLVVMLPDGEIEAAGTRFTVDVVLGRTKSVSVADGRVVLRRRDDRELTLHAGEGWSRTEPAAAEAIVAAEAAPAAASGGPTERPRRIATKSAARASTSAGERFDEAISSFVHGSYARADTQLIDFVREFPHDSRCEDASFLSAVARWRMGDASGARTQAQSYLGAYPQGLRRDEAQHIVDAVR